MIGLACILALPERPATYGRAANLQTNVYALGVACAVAVDLSASYVLKKIARARSQRNCRITMGIQMPTNLSPGWVKIGFADCWRDSRGPEPDITTKTERG
jgi:hypothetical protein